MQKNNTQRRNGKSLSGSPKTHANVPLCGQKKGENFAKQTLGKQVKAKVR